MARMRAALSVPPGNFDIRARFASFAVITERLAAATCVQVLLYQLLHACYLRICFARRGILLGSTRDYI